MRRPLVLLDSLVSLISRATAGRDGSRGSGIAAARGIAGVSRVSGTSGVWRVSPAALIASFVTVGCLAYGVYALALAQPGVPIHVPREMRFSTACLSPATPITQSFKVGADAIDAIAVYPVSKPAGAAAGAAGRAAGPVAGPSVAGSSTAGPALAGTVIFELRRADAAGVTDTSPPLHRYETDAASIAQARGTPAFVTLPRPEPAAGRKFVLTIAAGSALAGCLAFEASGVHLPDGELSVGGRPVWGDLLLSVQASRGTRLHALQTWIDRRLGVAPPRLLLGALAIVYALALGWLCYVLIEPPAATGPSVPSAPSAPSAQAAAPRATR